MSALDSIRIRLEGALETVEKATANAGEVTHGLRGRRWRAWLKTHRAQLERIADEAEHTNGAAARVEAFASAEQWRDGAVAVSQLREAHARLLQRIAQLDGETRRRPAAELAPVLRGFLARAIDEGTPLYVCERPGLATALEGIAFGAMSLVLLWLMTVNLDVRLTLAIGIAAVMLVLIGPVANRFRIEVFPRHIRIRSPLNEKRFLLDDHLFQRESAGLLKVGGERLLELGSLTCEQILTVQKLLSVVDWPAPVTPPSDGYVAPAYELVSRRQSGAMIACDGGLHFLRAGSRAYDVVARISKTWPRTDATLLGYILLRSPPAFRDDVLARLATEGCLVTLQPGTPLIVSRTTATFGDVAAVGMNRETRAELEKWSKRFRGLSLQRK